MTGFEQRPKIVKIAAAYHQLMVLGRVQQEEFWGTHWFRCCGTGILIRNPAEPWVVMSLRLNIQDFEELLQPRGQKDLEHVLCLSTSSDSKATGEDNKATGESKECRQMCCDTDLCLPYIFCSS